VNTLKIHALGPLPRRFRPGMHVAIRINGTIQHGVVGKHHTVPANLTGLPCGLYPVVINDVPNMRKIRPVLRIWALTGGNGLLRIGFPLPQTPLALS
jgi:hypothetical protein